MDNLFLRVFQKNRVSVIVKRLLLVFLLLYCSYYSHPQGSSQPRRWVKLMEENGSSQVLSALEVYNSLDTLHPERAVKELEAAVAGESKRVRTRANAVKSRFLFYWLGPGDSLYAEGMKQALADAYTLDDPFMIAEFSRWYGEMLNSLGNRPLAAQYCMNSLKMQEELGFRYFPTVKNFFLTTAEMLHRTINNDAAVKYYLAALRLPDDSANAKDYYYYKLYYAQSLNTLGKSYYGLKKFDSAVIWFEQSMKYVKDHHLPDDLYYVASDNRFDPYIELQQFDSCRKIADELYKAGLPGDSLTLIGACFMKGRIALRTGQPAEALKWDLQAEKYGGTHYKLLFQVYKDIISAMETLGKKDEVLSYYKKHQELQDANNEIKRKANASFLEAESEYQRSRVALTRLGTKHKNQLLVRNIAIAALVLLAATAIYYFNRKRRKSERARKEAEEKFHFFEKKYRTADEQLTVFRQEVEDKNRYIDELVAEKNKKERTKEEISQIDALSRQIILTEEDWSAFKTNFDQVHPGFTTALKHQAPDITNAEIRMACLMRLGFDARHIAGMLGISQVSVRKTKYRLKKRFENTDQKNLEEIISGI